MAGVWLLSASILTGGRARRGGGGDWRKGVCVGGGGEPFSFWLLKKNYIEICKEVPVRSH